MNTGQMLTVIGALVVLSMVTLNVNKVLVDKSTTMLDAEAGLNAVSIAQTMLDEIMTKAFDAATVTQKVYDNEMYKLTASGSLGRSSLEASNVPLPDPMPEGFKQYKSDKYYNDVDDYHLYRRVFRSIRLGDFTVRDSVLYVLETNPDQKSSTQTFMKKVVVTVSHYTMSSPLKLSEVAVYRRYF
ncbi:MAG TPA: hypothetical protein VFF29_06335 [Bacteroidota bacterium]|nr:hypothetical protein [Bacteroidota bacterium]